MQCVSFGRGPDPLIPCLIRTHQLFNLSILYIKLLTYFHDVCVKFSAHIINI
jgi:hypothetical protein